MSVTQSGVQTARAPDDPIQRTDTIRDPLEMQRTRKSPEQKTESSSGSTFGGLFDGFMSLFGDDESEDRAPQKQDDGNWYDGILDVLGFGDEDDTAKRDPDKRATAPSPTPAPSGGKRYTCAVSALNIRATPAVTPDNKIGVLNAGEDVTVLDSSGAWFRLSFQGRIGFASGKYLTPVSETDESEETAPESPTTDKDDKKTESPSGALTGGKMYTSAAALNVRDAPKGTVLGKLKVGQQVRVLDSTDQWFKIEYNGTVAYAYGTYLNPVKTPEELIVPLELGEDAGDREKYLVNFQKWLIERYKALKGMEGEALVSRVDGLLSLIEEVSSKVNDDTYPVIDELPTEPTSAGKAKGTFVPPELTGTVRVFIEILEEGVVGAEKPDVAIAEGSKSSDVDWNARLGVPQYRNQLDNLAAGEATCNVTSSAMTLERLGFNRQDVVDAVEREIKKAVLAKQGKKATAQNLAAVEISDSDWEKTVKKYLDKINSDTKNYRKLRGASTTDGQRSEISKLYKDNAQTEDLLDLLLSMMNFSRYSVVTSPDKMLKAVAPDEAERPTTEKLMPASLKWSKAKEKIGEVLKEGGAGILSFRHRGNNNATKTHLVSIQRVTAGGMITDDPYGATNDDYTGATGTEAYKQSGKTRSQSGLRNQTHTGDLEDWKLGRSQSMDENEKRGASNEMTDTLLKSVWNYVQLYRRAAPSEEGSTD
ncbi:MAG: SH3 domain-containing protein [Myxococcota bacterium]